MSSLRTALRIAVFVVLTLAPVAGRAQEPAAAVSRAAPTATTPVPPKDEATVGAHLGFGLGLVELDVQYQHFYAFASGSIGIPLVSGGDVGAAVAGLGLTVPLGDPNDSHWQFDLFAQVLPTWLNGSESGPSVGLGVGAGFRYLDRSGLTLSFKVPVAGFAVGSGAGSTLSSQVGTYYVANLIAQPLVAVGYRF